MALFDPLRAFAALNVEVLGVRRIAEVAERLRTLPGAQPFAPDLSWMPATKLHLTLKFFGEIDAALVPVLRDGLSVLAKDHAAPQLAFQGLSAFPSTDAARVVYAAVDDRGGEAKALASAVDALGESLGLPREPRAYLPHVTLARARRPLDVAAWLASAPAWRVVAAAPELVLYRSDTSRPGAEYDALGRFVLSARRQGKRARRG